MATKIKDTPVLTGQDARRFREMIEYNRDKKVPRIDYQRARDAYRMIGNLTDK